MKTAEKMRWVGQPLEMGDSLTRYLQEISYHGLLTADEEVELAQAIEAGRDAEEQLATVSVRGAQKVRLERTVRKGRDARERFTQANLRLVVSQAKRYRSQYGIEFIDLIQEGNLGLIRAVEKFDWRKGFKFSTYATWWIRQSMQRAVAEKSRTVRLPNSLHDTLVTLNSTRNRLLSELGREPTPEELSDESGLSLSAVVEAQLVNDSVSLEAPVGEDGAVLGDFVAHHDEEDPVRETEKATAIEALREAINRLPEREAYILSMRVGFEDGLPRTHEEIGGNLGLGPTRVRSIEKLALSKLRHPAFGLNEDAMDF
ncbi:MAG TPA: sigma-70 family RNA polymerase sigma factor [Acidimicrobiia bacterium]|nr:sigma-70 family RNA polymerase sigma factor [Acidimicrobiia bacterium]